MASRPRECSIANALAVVGERWSLLVIREVMFGVRRFDQIARDTGASCDVLAARLRRLVAAGLLERRQYEQHPPRIRPHRIRPGPPHRAAHPHGVGRPPCHRGRAAHRPGARLRRGSAPAHGLRPLPRARDPRNDEGPPPRPAFAPFLKRSRRPVPSCSYVRSCVGPHRRAADPRPGPTARPGRRGVAPPGSGPPRRGPWGRRCPPAGGRRRR